MPDPVKQKKQGYNCGKKTITQKSDVGHYSIQKGKMKPVKNDEAFCFWNSIDIDYSYDQECIVIIKFPVYKLYFFSQFPKVCIRSTIINIQKQQFI